MHVYRLHWCGYTPVGICDDITIGAENDDNHDGILHNVIQVVADNVLLMLNSEKGL